MTPVKQTKFPKDQEKGNSLSACVASLLEVPINLVPDLSLEGDWFDQLQTFARDSGFTILFWTAKDRQPLICLHGHLIMLLSLEGREYKHAVVAKSRLQYKEPKESGGYDWFWMAELEHDPNPTDLLPKVSEVFGYLMIVRS